MKLHTSPPPYLWGKGGGERGGESLLGGLPSFRENFSPETRLGSSLVSLRCLLRLNIIEGSAWEMRSRKDEKQLSLDTVSILFYRKC